MKKLFHSLKLKQSLIVLSLLGAGLLLSGKASATCTAHIYYNVRSLTVVFSDSGSTALSDPHTTSWNFGDSTSDSTDNPHHSFRYAGTFHVCVTVYDTKTSCSASYCTNVTTTGCSLTASFSNTLISVSARKLKFISTGSSSSTMKYVWSFGDGSTDSTSGDTVTHVFSGTANNFGVSLSINDTKSGCTAATTQYIAICPVSTRMSIYPSGKTVSFSGDSANSSSDTYAWTLGDGSTRADMHFNYTYANWGTYTVCVTVTDPTYSCSAKYCNSLSISEPTYCITGSVSAGTGLVAPCKVYLISFNATDSSLTAVDSTEISRDSSKYYEFCGIKNGTYYTKAALLPTSPNYSSYVPTYHNDALRWKTAIAITVSGASVSNVNINMKAGTNSGGPGFIGGKISAGANKVGDPVVGIEVVLYDANSNPVGYTYSDINGEYGFSNLAYGTYTLEADIPGKTDYPFSVTINAANPKPTGENLIVDSKSIFGSDHSAGIKGAEAITDATVYPNPVNDKLMISADLQTAQNGTVEIFDGAGKLVSVKDESLTAGPQTLEINTASFHAGVYFIKIQLQKENRSLEARFVKAQ